jgi:DNA-binding SARP family transcriptional activator
MERIRVLAGASLMVALAMGGLNAAQARDAKIPGDRFLSWNEAHKNVYVSGLMDAEEHLVDTCMSDATAEQLSKLLTSWLREHPEAMREPAHRAFVRAVSEMCR